MNGPADRDKRIAEEVYRRVRRTLLWAITPGHKRLEEGLKALRFLLGRLDEQRERADAAEARASSWQRKAERLAGCLNDAMAFIPEEVARDYPLWREALRVYNENNQEGAR